MCSTWWPAVFSVIASACAISLLVSTLREQAQHLDLALAQPGRVTLTDLAAAQRPPPRAPRRRCASRRLRRAPSRRARARACSGRSAAPVRAIVGHRVIGVGGGQEPRSDAQLRGLGSAVIARAVEPLVMRAGDRGQRRERRRHARARARCSRDGGGRAPARPRSARPACPRSRSAPRPCRRRAGSPPLRTSETSAREQPSASAAVAASSATRAECPCRNPTFTSVNSPNARATVSSPAPRDRRDRLAARSR